MAWSSVGGSQGGVRLSPGPRLTLGRPDSAPARGLEWLPCRPPAARHGSGDGAAARGGQDCGTRGTAAFVNCVNGSKASKS